MPALDNIGSPIAEVFPDGSAIITKLAGTGGTVTRATCIEQLLYEVHDPGNYITPDVVADFTGMEMEEAGPDRVRVWGATGRPATDTLKVSVGYLDGFVGEGQISYAGEGMRDSCATGRRHHSTPAGIGRCASGQSQIELIGVDAILGRQRSAGRPEPAEVRLRVAGRSTDRDAAERLGVKWRDCGSPAPMAAPARRGTFGRCCRSRRSCCRGVWFVPKSTSWSPRQAMRTKLRQIAHSRAGDKGDVSNVSLIVYDLETLPGDRSGR